MKCFVTIVVGNDYRGLDSDSAKWEEIKTTIRFFSDVLTGTRAIFSSECPIQCLDNVKAISLIPLLAWLAIELGYSEEQERGGLLFCDDDTIENILQNLMHSHTTEQSKHEIDLTKTMIGERTYGNFISTMIEI